MSNGRKKLKGSIHDLVVGATVEVGLQRGANLTEQSLLALDCESFTYNGLKAFIENIEFVLNAIPYDHQPS